MRTGIDAAWRAAYALALIAGRCLLTDNWDLDLALFSESIFLAVHRNVSIGAIARTEAAADAVVLDDNLLGTLAEDGIDWAAN